MGDESVEYLQDFIDWLEWSGYRICNYGLNEFREYAYKPVSTTKERLAERYLEDIENDGDVLE